MADEVLTTAHIKVLEVGINNINEKVCKIEEHIKVQNGRVHKNELDIVAIQTAQKYESNFNEKEHERTEKAQDDGRKFDLDILKKNSTMITTIILFIITLVQVFRP